jgi:hypothetical protein
VRRGLRTDRAAGLSERRGRRCEHDPANPGRRRGVHDIPRAPHVDLEQRRCVTEAERVDAGGVVDDLTSAHRGGERLGVEDVAADGLRAQLAERAS